MNLISYGQHYGSWEQENDAGNYKDAKEADDAFEVLMVIK